MLTHSSPVPATVQRVIALAGATFLLALPASAFRASDNASQGASVKVDRYVFTLKKGVHKVWHVNFSYSFPTVKELYLDGVGKVEPTGKLSYLTDRQELRFLDKDGKLIQAVP